MSKPVSPRIGMMDPQPVMKIIVYIITFCIAPPGLKKLISVGVAGAEVRMALTKDPPVNITASAVTGV